MNEQDDLTMMKDKNMWPGDVLCLKRSIKYTPNTGFLTHVSPQIAIGNIFDVIYDGAEVTEVKSYNSFEELIADGWRVD